MRTGRPSLLALYAVLGVVTVNGCNEKQSLPTREEATQHPTLQTPPEPTQAFSAATPKPQQTAIPAIDPVRIVENGSARATSTKHGPEVIGTGGPPNFGICATIFMRNALQVNKSQMSAESDEAEYRDWFCSTSDNKTAFNFAQALKALVPDFPVPFEANTAASYEKTKREGACKDLQNRHFHQYLQQINEKVTDNRFAIEQFNQCVSTIASNGSGHGGLIAGATIFDPYSKSSGVEVVATWMPPTNTSAFVPWVRDFTTTGGVACTTSTLPKDTELKPPTAHILSCQRTSCEPSSVVVHTYTAGDVSAKIPACLVNPCPGVDLQTDGKNCGKCGIACGTNEVCSAGECLKTYCESHPNPGAVTAGTETVLSCRMKPGATVTVSLSGNRGMADNTVFPGCSGGMCDINSYSVRTVFSALGFSATPHCEGKHTQPCSLQAQGTVTVPSDGILTLKLRADGCDWWQYKSCDLSFLTLSAKQ